MAETRETLIYDFQIDSSSYKEIEGINNKLNGITGTLKNIGLGIATAFGSMKLYDIAKNILFDTEKLQNSMRVFDNYAKRIGASSQEMLENLRQASNYAIDDIELINKTIIADQFNLQTSTAELLELARKQAFTMGQDVNYFFDSLTLGLSRQSKLIIDNLGITIDQEKALNIQARVLKKTVDQLTESERNQAFELAVVSELREKVYKSGIQDFSTLAENLNAINIGIKTLGRNLFNDIVPYAKETSNYFAKIVKDLVFIQEQNKKDATNAEVLQIQKKLTDLSERRVLAEKQLMESSNNISKTMGDVYLRNAEKILENEKVRSGLSQAQIWDLQTLVKLQNEVANIPKQELALQNLITKQKESDKRANLEKVKTEIENTREIIKQNKAKEEQIIQDQQLIQLNQRKKDLSVDYTNFIKGFEIQLIKNEKDRIIAQNQFEMEEAIKKFNIIGESEEKIRSLFLEKQGQMLEELSKKKEKLPKTAVELLLERMDENIKSKSENVLLSLQAFTNANEYAITSLVENGKASLGEYFKILAQETKARLISIATQSSVLSLFSFAEGLFNPLQRKEKFEASAMYAKTAVIAGLGAGAVNATFGLSSANTGGGEGAGTTATREVREQMIKEKEVGTNLTVVFQGGVVGVDGKEIGRYVANQISKDNRIRDVIVRNE
jgi:hypothetical protein